MIKKLKFGSVYFSIVVVAILFSLSITNAQTPTPSIPTLSTPTASSIGAGSATLNSSITSTGGSSVTARGFNYGLTTSYGTTFNQTPGPYSTGAFSQFVPNLSCGTTYNYRSFATNAYGTRYSSNATFTTTACPTPSATPNPAPTVSTNFASGINLGLNNVASATLNGNISSTGGGSLTVSRRGFQYGESSYTDSVCEDGSFSAGSYSRSSGTTCGAVTASALSCGKNYIYRAFATNINGTSYGSQSSFSTPSCPTPTPTSTATPTATPSVAATPSANPTPGGPSLTVSAPNSVGSYSATLNGNITSVNGSNVTARGFNYGITTNYGITHNQNSGPYSTGAFSQSISDLSCDTTYYFRAFATNSSGTSYSNGSSFVTESCPTPTPTPTSTATPTPTPTATPSVTPTPTSTATPTPTPTPTPTSTPSPTSTASPTPTPTPSVDPTPTSTPLPANLAGWAWSSNIGWINLTPISINPVSGNLTGYAWSPNIGWIKFHDLSSYPANGAPGVPANINPNTGEVKGWIRACAGTATGNCSTMVSRTDGWDGWIELAGANHQSVNPPVLNNEGEVISGVRMDTSTGSTTGMAWGGDVVGWLSFNAKSSAPVAKNFTATCSPANRLNGKVRFTAKPSGGSGNYEYKWNNAANFASSPTFYEAVINGSTPISIPLQVREFGKNNPISLVCTYNPSNSNITSDKDPACTVTPTNFLVGTQVVLNFVGNLSPVQTYTYTWSTGVGTQSSGTTKNLTYTYNNAGSYTVSATVRGSDGSAKNFVCGNIKVSNKELKLYIGENENDIGIKKNINNGAKYYTTKVGGPFRVEWNNTLDLASPTNLAPYTCIKSVDDKSDTWAPIWEGNNDKSGSFDKVTSKVGTYKLKISCIAGNQVLYPAISDEVTLKVISSYVKEI